MELNGVQKYSSKKGLYRHAAVVSDSKICSDIGNDVLFHMGGNAIDATVAALLCTGVVNAQSTGIGGGSLYTIYHKSTNNFYCVDSRETAPAAAKADMFSEYERGLSLLGGLAVGVPGQVLGLYEVHQRFGKVPWKSLVLPVKKLCEEGVPLTPATYRAVRIQLAQTSAFYRKQFAHYFDETGDPKPVGSLIKLPELAETFQKIADDPLSFYQGALAQDIVDDLSKHDGIITLADLQRYRVKWTKPASITLTGGYQVYSAPPPGGGIVLNFILNILNGYNMSPSSIADDASTVLTYHRAAEAMKFAYSLRSELADENFVDMKQHIRDTSTLSYGDCFRAKIDDTRTYGTNYYNPSFSIKENHGTTHLSVLDSEGNAVSVSGTLNRHFGSKVKGKKTGIVFNDVMDDFSTPNATNFSNFPASPSNYIQPGKRPMSSMSPTIVMDASGKVRLIIGAAGGGKIPSTVALNIMNVLWFGESLQESINKFRFHHQLMPKEMLVEQGFSPTIQDGLKAKGHAIFERLDPGFSVVQAIEVRKDGTIVGVADGRKGGEPSGY